jgi:flagellar protein FlgJ
MNVNSVAPSNYADFSGLEALKGSARANDPAALREAARQFESLFTNMMLKSMRAASLGEGMGDSEETGFYQEMYDQQLSVSLAKGNGIGLAQRLVEQLMRSGMAGATTDGVTPPTDVPLAAATPEQQQQFVAALQPAATAAAQRLGVAPESIIAQAALETGWGRFVPADDRGSSHNLFGIKAGESGPAVVALTTEVVDGTASRVTQGFRRYDSPAASVAAYAQLLATSPRYADARNAGTDVHAFAQALQRGGYATDPDYAGKLEAAAAVVRQLNNHG